ncbi:hypothetical protein COT78_00125 [Candidatus Berkelbacteria bacterium CG10_big_fil_rev_8_21_14_0_10_43_13]|uniref:Membrane insertase YidC/Oxa/ALB C-terminal domain-containing protein n=1 Tax=Candidatus Berkelbacteria bacterium CG10_big_fil_rev_8_21_14_0_10_43_13 TaxID=1974514 RepID=A0A2H0W7L9_9BACT|nr:MAG: hypothetical protein COT78_00125 [Candidatus Berkelbacteria bacterium CG10_big_fil_rev_8_21_14_0_10_43_13]
MKAFFYTLLYQPLYNFLILIAWLIPGHSMGFAIVVLTIVIRLILLPQSLKAAKLQVKNFELQPKISKIRSEIKDQREQSQAMMNLYKEEGVSPFGSCLPLLIQLPLLIVLYSVFRNGLAAINLKDLYSFVPHAFSINNSFFGLDLTKTDPWILPIIAGVSQLVLSLMMMPPQPKTAGEKADPTAMMSRQMTYFLPIMTIFIGRSMPAALVIYWIVTTLFSLVQQWYVNQIIASEKLKIKSGALSAPVVSATPKSPVKPDAPKKKEDMLMRMMNKRLDKKEKKAGVNVTVRTKKRG